MSKEPTGTEVETPTEDDMSVADMMGREDETIEVGHGGVPIVLAVCIGLVLLWALVAWRPWGGY